MHIVSVGKALPPHRYDQDTLISALEAEWAKQHFNPARVPQVSSSGPGR